MLKRSYYFSGLFAVALLALVWVMSPGADPAVAKTNSVETAGGCSIGTNLLVNGDAEGDSAATGDGTVDHDVSAWNPETGQFTVTRYTTGGGYPTGSSPGPANRGTFFFSGGQATPSTASQTISVSDCATQIDAGTLRFGLNGFLGGFETPV